MKDFYRSNINLRRQNLTEENLTEFGKEIRDIFCDDSPAEFRKLLSDSQTIALYHDVRGELKTGSLAERLLSMGKTLCYPRVSGDTISFYTVKDLDKDFVKGAYGIPEPCDSCTPVDASSIDMIVVPAVAFNDEGVRLGMGGGYYDRFCASCDAVTVGICYDFQINSSIPVEDHDLCVDYIFVVETEEEL